MLAEGVTGFRQMSGSPALLKKRRDNALPIGRRRRLCLRHPEPFSPRSIPDRVRLLPPRSGVSTTRGPTS